MKPLEMLREIARLRAQMKADYGFRNLAGHAEAIIALARKGHVNRSSVERGYDVISEADERIEVKHRCLADPTSTEKRVHIAKSKEGGFQILAIVIFNPDLTVYGSVLLPYEVAWECSRRYEQRRIPFEEALRLPGAQNITANVRESQASLEADPNVRRWADPSTWQHSLFAMTSASSSPPRTTITRKRRRLRARR